ncbi:MAG: hypothetical protein PVSMB7_24120 [Chloroflexota bacterium]
MTDEPTDTNDLKQLVDDAMSDKSHELGDVDRTRELYNILSQSAAGMAEERRNES